METQIITSGSQFFPAINFKQPGNDRKQQAADRTTDRIRRIRYQASLGIFFKNLQQAHAAEGSTSDQEQDQQSSAHLIIEPNSSNVAGVEHQSVFQHCRLFLHRLFRSHKLEKHPQVQETLHEDQ